MEFHPTTLRRLDRMYKRWAVAQVCSECGKAAGDMNPEIPHVFQSELDAVLKRADLKQAQKEALSLRIERVIHHSSRCCGAELELKYCDYYQVLYDGWASRYRSPVFRQLDHDAMDSDTKEVLLPSLRVRYGDFARHRSDDFILMWAIWGLGDGATGELVNIFTEADQLHAETNTVKVEVSPDGPKTVEEELLAWVATW